MKPGVFAVTWITILLYLRLALPAALVWIGCCLLWTLACNFLRLLVSLISRFSRPSRNDQSLLLNGCVVDWRESIRNVNWCVLNRGLWYSTMPPLRTVTQQPWAPGWSVEVEGLLAGAKLGGPAEASGGWLTTAMESSKLRSRASKLLSRASIATNTLNLAVLFLTFYFYLIHQINNLCFGLQICCGTGRTWEWGKSGAN